jgi:hypothetical protein
MEIIFISYSSDNVHYKRCQLDNSSDNSSKKLAPIMGTGGINEINNKDVSKSTLASTAMVCKFNDGSIV